MRDDGIGDSNGGQRDRDKGCEPQLPQITLRGVFGARSFVARPHGLSPPRRLRVVPCGSPCCTTVTVRVNRVARTLLSIKRLIFCVDQDMMSSSTRRTATTSRK